MNKTVETIGNATGKTGWRKTFPKKWTPPAQPCGAWGKKMDQTYIPEQIMLSAVNAFGIDHQTDKCIEELGELATALIQYRQGRIGLDVLLGELADVQVTTGQLRLHYGARSVDQIVAVKLARLRRRVADQVQANVQSKPEPSPVNPQPVPGKTLCVDCPHWHPVMDHPSEYGVCHHPARPWDTAERRAKDGPYLAATNREEVCLLPVPKPVKPVLRWEAGRGDELVLYDGASRLGSVSRSPYWAYQWTATAAGCDRSTHASKETAMHIVCMELGIVACTVPIWPVSP